MGEMVGADIWSTSVTDWSAVTAFKLVANEGTALPGQSSFQARIPTRVVSSLPEDSMDLLAGKTYRDQNEAQTAYLESINSFGFRDSRTSNGIVGAESALTGADGSMIQAGSSDIPSFLLFACAGFLLLSHSVKRKCTHSASS